MSSFISDELGIWHPAKESVPLKNNTDRPIEIEQTSSDGKKFKQVVKPGGSYIYEGPDRAAMFQWWEENGKPSAEKMREMEGNITFGSNFRGDSEFINYYGKFRQSMGFVNMEEFLTFVGYDAKKSHARFLEKASMVTTHDAPTRLSEVQKLGGGTDNANPGKNLRYGGFGDMPSV